MAASYALTDIRQQIRDTINEPTARIFTDTQIDYFIDMGAGVCSALTLCNEVEEDETCLETTYVYSPTTYNFVHIDSVAYVNVESSNIEYGLQRINLQAYGHVCGLAASIPLYYFVHWAGVHPEIYIAPPPNAAMAAAFHIITIRGSEYVDGFGGAASETLPDSLQYVPYYYGMSCIYARLGKHSLSALNMQKFIQECNQYKMDIRGTLDRVDSHDMARLPDITIPVS